MAAKKIFILGVGAQKCGTTWLHSQLVRNACVDMGFAKEYHVFDAFSVPVCASIKTGLIDKVLAKNSNGRLGRNARASCLLARRLSFIDNTENYFDYFDYLYLKNPDVQAVGDITPSYSMLDARMFRHIKNGLEARGFTVKVVFLMRDPVERVWSMLRMDRRLSQQKRRKRSAASTLNAGIRALLRPGQQGLPASQEGRDLEGLSENQALATAYKTDAFALRTRYDNTIRTLEQVFESENIFYGYYEALFNKQEFSRLQVFLGLDLVAANFENLVNASPKTDRIDESLYREIACYFEPVYRFVSQKSDGKVDRLWPGFAYLPAPVSS
jgi:hypothetical protein